MTSSMGCGIWGGNITNENISLKHYMNVTWVSRPIAEDKPSEAELFGEFYNTRDHGLRRYGSTMRHRQAKPPSSASRPRAETRIASYLLTDYLERLGVEVIFGLCGHTVIGFLDALGKSRIRFISTRHEQVAAHAADGYARASGKVGVLMTHLGPGLTNAATGVANAALDSIPMVVIAGDIPSLLLRPPSAPGSEPAPGRGSVPDLPAVLQARLSRRQRPRSAAHRRARVPSCADRAGPARCWSTCRWTSSRPISTSTRLRRRRRRSPSRVSIRRPRRGSSMRSPTSRRPVLYAGGGVLSARATRGAAGARRGAASPGRAHADGEGLPAARASAAARPVRILGHADREREVPHRRSHRRDRHAPRRGQLELVGSALHLLDSADAPDPHRRRSRRDRPQLPDRAGRRGRCEAGAGGAGRRGARQASRRSRTADARRSRAAARSSPRTGPTSGARDSSRCGPSAS